MVIKDLYKIELEAFYDCFSELMQEGYGQFPKELSEYFLKKDYALENFNSWLDRNIRKILIAQDENGKVQGFLVGDHSYGGVGFISWFGIRKEFRGKGLGRKMYEVYESYLLGKNAHLIELYTYDGAKGFYEKLGFSEIGRRSPGFYGQLNIIMNKRLGDWSNANLSL